MKQETNTLTVTSVKTLGMVQMALFGAIIVLMAFTPFLGYIPLGFTRATIIHIPVIIGSILLGPVKGGILGFIFGLTSLVNNTVNPTITSFVFSPFYSLGDIQGGWGSLVVCFVPRILVGVVPYYVFKSFSKRLVNRSRGKEISLALAGFVGSMTNTILVMNLIYVLFGKTYAAVQNKGIDTLYTAILAVIGTNGIPEAIVAAILVSFVTRALLRSKNIQRML